MMLKSSLVCYQDMQQSLMYKGMLFIEICVHILMVPCMIAVACTTCLMQRQLLQVPSKEVARRGGEISAWYCPTVVYSRP
jgi:membrane glycosyltransferase